MWQTMTPSVLVRTGKHFGLVMRHKVLVARLCFRAGIPWRGIMHDWSKFSPTEFWEGVKYFDGSFSPIRNRKKEVGYSEAQLHHLGRNKHHYGYWYDYSSPVAAPPMPYKYLVEMVCDGLAAGMIYEGKKWTKDYQIKFWKKKMERDAEYMHPTTVAFATAVFEEVAEKGVDAVITRENMRAMYEQYVGSVLRKSV